MDMPDNRLAGIKGFRGASLFRQIGKTLFSFCIEPDGKDGLACSRYTSMAGLLT